MSTKEDQAIIVAANSPPIKTDKAPLFGDHLFLIGLCLGALSVIYSWHLLYIGFAISDIDNLMLVAEQHRGRLVISKTGFRQTGFCIDPSDTRGKKICLPTLVPIKFNPQGMEGKVAFARTYDRIGVIEFEVEEKQVLSAIDLQNHYRGAIYKFLALISLSAVLIIFSLHRNRKS